MSDKYVIQTQLCQIAHGSTVINRELMKSHAGVFVLLQTVVYSLLYLLFIALSLFNRRYSKKAFTVP